MDVTALEIRLPLVTSATDERVRADLGERARLANEIPPLARAHSRHRANRSHMSHFHHGDRLSRRGRWPATDRRRHLVCDSVYGRWDRDRSLG